MNLKALFNVLYSHKVTIYKHCGHGGALLSELYSGSQKDVPEELLSFTVMSINADGRGIFDIIVALL